MKHRILLSSKLLIVFLLITNLAAIPALELAETKSEEHLEQQRRQALSEDGRRISALLACPVCEGESVLDSNSGIAVQIRNLVESKLQSGESEKQILSYFVERYGTGILVEPPKKGVALGVWLVLPSIIVAIILVLWKLSATNRPPARTLHNHMTPQEEERVDQELEVRQQC